jgi:hypothetical protein
MKGFVKSTCRILRRSAPLVVSRKPRVDLTRRRSLLYIPTKSASLLALQLGLIDASTGAPMTCLKEFPWWPTAWVEERGGSASPTEVSKDAVLKNARRVPGGLTLVVDHNGVTYTAQIAVHLSEDVLILLRHILLQHWGEPLAAVENFDVNFGDWK